MERSLRQIDRDGIGRAAVSGEVNVQDQAVGDPCSYGWEEEHCYWELGRVKCGEAAVLVEHGVLLLLIIMSLSLVVEWAYP